MYQKNVAKTAFSKFQQNSTLKLKILLVCNLKTKYYLPYPFTKALKIALKLNNK